MCIKILSHNPVTDKSCSTYCFRYSMSISAVAGTIFTIACPKGKATWMLLSLLYGHLLGEWWTLKGDRQEHHHRQDNHQQLVALNLRVSELETLLEGTQERQENTVMYDVVQRIATERRL